MIGRKRLYHFTFVTYLPLILYLDRLIGKPRGIRPSLDTQAKYQTGGRPVVWLTERPSLKPTAADLEWLKNQHALSAEAKADYREYGPIGDRTAMLEVELSTVSKRLWRWGSWLRSNGGSAVLQAASPSARAEWWVYFGTISGDHIVGFCWTNVPSRDEYEDKLKTEIAAAFSEQDEVA
jgi:hypothetical protein